MTMGGGVSTGVSAHSMFGVLVVLAPDGFCTISDVKVDCHSGLINFNCKELMCHIQEETTTLLRWDKSIHLFFAFHAPQRGRLPIVVVCPKKEKSMDDPWHG